MAKYDWAKHNKFDEIKTAPASQAYREGWERTFGRGEEKAEGAEREQAEPSTEASP